MKLPVWIEISVLEEICDIHRTTILEWCKKGYIRNRYGKPGRGNATVIHTKDFFSFVRKHYRYGTMKPGRKGKKWTKEEISKLRTTNDLDRSKMAVKVKKSKIRKG